MKKILRRQILASLVLAAFFPALSTAAEDPVYTSFFSGAGADGYDVVAYFTENKPVKGDKKFMTEYMGAKWHFASQENLDMFTQNPEAYAPQYGGYCAWAVAKGSTASGDPLQWSIVNDKLYLNYNADIQAKWSADKENLINQGDENWPDVLN